MTQDITSLIEKLEGAEVGSRELDALTWLRFNRPEYSGGVKALEMRGWYDGHGHMILETDAGEEVADGLGIGTYTTSLDAALALAERVGVRPYQADASIKGKWSWMVVDEARLGDLEANAYARATAATPALALCAALLRAQSEAR